MGLPREDADARFRMLIYRLEVKGASLSVRLEEEASPRRILYLDSLKSSKDPALQFLVPLHIKSNAGRSLDTLSFQEILLPPASSAQAIRLLLQTGRLFFKKEKLMARRARLHWKGDGSLGAFLDEMPLETVELLFPGWAIVKGEWIEFETKVSWKWVERFRTGKLFLQGAELKRFLDEEPPLVWAKKEEVPIKVFPQLQLTDGTGSFANLWMDYPGLGRVAFEDLAPGIGGKGRLKKEEAEWEKDLVEAGFLRKQVGHSRYYCPADQVQKTLRFLLELGWSCLDAKGRFILLQTGCDLSLTEREGQIAIAGKVRFQEKEGSYRAAQKSRMFLDLDGQNVGLLDAKEIPLLEGEWEEDTVLLPKRRIGEVLPLLDRGEWEASLEKAARALKNGSGFEPLTLNGDFRGQLLPYQQKGVEWLSLLHQWGFGALLSDEMGLGKTVQAVAFFSQLRTNLPILVVAPTSLLSNWRQEIARFWPAAKVYVHSGPDRLFRSEQVVLTSYAILRLDQELFSGMEFETVLLDESQVIKSFQSQAARAACSLRARFRIAMSGTPIENRLDELWSQFRFLSPELFGERSAFAALPPDVIRRKIKPFLLRRQKADVQIQLPDKIDRPVWIDFEERQQTLYDQTLSSFKSGLLQKVLADGLQAHRMEVLEVILRLRQIAADPRLLGEPRMGAKAELFLDAAEELAADGKKALVFSQFTTFLRLLEKDLRARGIEPLYLDGSTPAEERGEIVRRFQEEGKPHLFLLSLKAGGVGLNLTAAESVFILDPWWNEAVEQQAIDRAHRIGQKKTLFVHRYLTPNSIEEKILSIKTGKLASSGSILQGEDGSSLSQDDLLALLRD